MPLKLIAPHTQKLPTGKVNESYIVSSRPSAIALQMAKRGRAITTFTVNHSETEVDDRCLVYCSQLKVWVDVKHFTNALGGISRCHGDVLWSDHELMCSNPKCPVRTGGE
jgi:hypothetical protein